MKIWPDLSRTIAARSRARVSTFRMHGKICLFTWRRDRFRFSPANLRRSLSPCSATPRTAIIAHREGGPAWRQRRCNSVRTTGNTIPTSMFSLRTKFSASTTYTSNKLRPAWLDTEDLLKSHPRPKNAEALRPPGKEVRSEEHTSELQSPDHL